MIFSCFTVGERGSGADIIKAGRTEGLGTGDGVTLFNKEEEQPEEEEERAVRQGVGRVLSIVVTSCSLSSSETTEALLRM
jgi:hypothetical protein